MTPQPADPVTAETAGISTAVEMARLTGRIDQVIVDHERRLAALEARQSGAGSRWAGIASPWIAFAALAVLLAGKVQWV